MHAAPREAAPLLQSARVTIGALAAAAQTPAAACTSAAGMTSTSAPSVSFTTTPRLACTFSGRTRSSRSTLSYLGLYRHASIKLNSQQ